MGRGGGGSGGKAGIAGGASGRAREVDPLQARREAIQARQKAAADAAQAAEDAKYAADDAAGILTDRDTGMISRYTQFEYNSVNSYLGGFGPNISEDLVKPKIVALDRALAKIPSLPGDTYRTVEFASTGDAIAYASQFKVGETAVFKNYLSTSRSKSLWDFDKPSAKGNRVIKHTITGKNGKNIESYSFHKNEQETLFGRGSQFKVTRVSQQSNGEWHIHMTEI